MTGRIVLDISTLYRWTTRDVGITRTERMLARRLLVREHAMFVRYDAESRAYAEVPLAEVRRIVAGAEEESASDDSLPEPVSALTRKRQLIVAAKWRSDTPSNGCRLRLAPIIGRRFVIRGSPFPGHWPVRRRSNGPQTPDL